MVGWLGEKSLGACLERRLPGTLRIAATQNDNGHKGKGAKLLEPVHEKKAVTTGQADVQDNEIWFLLPCRGHTRDRVSSHNGLIVAGC